MGTETVTETWIAIRPFIIGNPSAGYSTKHESDLKEFPARKKAINHGFETVGYDDFLVGKLDRGRLVLLAWMNKDRDDGEEIATVRHQLDLERPRSPDVAETLRRVDAGEIPPMPESTDRFMARMDRAREAEISVEDDRRPEETP